MTSPYQNHVPAFKALSDETRLKIIDTLSCNEMCACHLLAGLSISQSTLSYHMKILSDSGLVKAERSGTWMRYSLNHQRLQDILTFLTAITNKKADCICGLSENIACEC